MAVNVDGSTIVHGDGDAIITAWYQIQRLRTFLLLLPIHLRKVLGCRDEYNNFGGSCRYENGRQVILQRNVMHQYTRDQMLRQSNIRVTHVINL